MTVFFGAFAGVCLLVWGVSAWISALHWVHLLQLQSYRPTEVWRRLVGAPRKLAGGLLPAALSLPFAYFATATAGRAWLWGVCAWLFAVCAWGSSPRERAKKPFVLAAALVCSPLIAWVACELCAPVEAWVKRWYRRDALRRLRACPDLLTVGVTGSYGKTSVKTYLGALLDVQFDTLITPESFNTPMGVVRTVREHLRPTHEVFVCEMGARHVGDIKELCDMVHPRHGVITAIGNQHLETFHTQENIVRTKFELADALPPDGLLFLNGDCDLIRDNLPDRPRLLYGLREGNDYRATDVEVSLSGTAFTLTAPDGETVRFRMRLLGEHSVLNVTGALAVCHAFGIPLASLAPAVRKLTAVPHRMQLLPGEVTYIDDAYNSNPAGCRAALETLGRFDACRILVTPGMVELGTDTEKCNEAFGEQAAEVCDYCVLVGEKQAIPIRRGLEARGYPSAQIRVVRTLDEALAAVRSFPTEKRKVVLLENDLPDQY